MAVLTAAKRNKLPGKTFAGPDRSYPIPDRSHAGNAKARAKQQLEAGRLSQAAYDKIVAKANRKLGESGKGGSKDGDDEPDGADRSRQFERGKDVRDVDETRGDASFKASY